LVLTHSDHRTERRLKRSVCRQILDFANSVGSRSVAEGIENREDFRCVRDMSFDIVQGSLFAKPMMARKMQQYLLGRSPTPRHCHIHPGAALGERSPNAESDG
jgi:EAL domain-containing protein (putative c-di-GMP-specific phosphodiesterase class I)